MSRKKLKVDDRRFLRKAGFRREHGGLAGLACALHEAETGPRPAGYVLQADSSWGERTRRRGRDRISTRRFAACRLHRFWRERGCRWRIPGSSPGRGGPLSTLGRVGRFL